jgi:CRISPR system Cascade subunit CasA
MVGSFDLADNPWVPVRIGGEEIRVGLRQLFTTANVIEDLTLQSPPAASGLWRILYAIAARITELDDPDYLDDDGGRIRWYSDRRDYFGRSGFDEGRVTAYFDGLAPRFDLFGAEGGGPFLQDLRLASQCTKTSGVNKLVFPRSSGNNHVWWSRNTDDNPQALEPAEAAWWLIAQLYYGASGRCTSRTVGDVSSASTKAGPLRGVISFHPLGRNLFESLLAGLPAPPSWDVADDDHCPWETAELDPLGGVRPVTWPGMMLTGRARHAALLVPSSDRAEVVDAYVTWGDPEPTPTAVDPYVILNRSQKDGSPYARPASLERALWRDLDALFLKNNEDGTQRPSVFKELHFLPPDVHDALRVRAYGFDQDGQASDKQYFTAVTPPVLAYAEQDHALHMHHCRHAAERVGRQLVAAARIAWQESAEGVRKRTDGRSSGPWVAKALADYWPHAEQDFWDLLARPEGRAPVSLFVATAVRALDGAVGNTESTQQGAKALAHARAMLYALRRPKPQQPTSGPTEGIEE